MDCGLVVTAMVVVLVMVTFIGGVVGKLSTLRNIRHTSE